MTRLATWLAIGAGLVWLSYTIHGLRSPFQPLVESDGDSGSLGRQVLFASCAALASLGLLAAGRVREIWSQRFGWLVLASLMALTAGYSERPDLTAKRAILFTCGLITALAMAHLARRPVELVLWGTTLVVGALASVSLGMWVSLPADLWQTPSRPGLAGIAGHPNTLGPALAIGLLVSFGIATKRSLPRVAVLGSRAAMAVALILTDSIASILVALFGSAVYLWLASSGPRRTAIALVALLFLPWLALDLQMVVRDMLTAVGRNTSMSGRDVLWLEALREFWSRPFLGAGYGAFWYEGRGREMVGNWNPRQSHNAYLDLTLDIGVLGGVVLLVRILPPLVSAWHSLSRTPSHGRRATAALLATVIALLGVGAFAESYLLKMDKFQFFVLIWILLVIEPRRLPESRELRLMLPQAAPYGPVGPALP